MKIQLTKTDYTKIANNVKEGGGNYSELEVELAKKIISLYEIMDRLNNEKNCCFEALYSAMCKVEKATNGALMNKRKIDLEKQAEANRLSAYRLEKELDRLKNE